MPLLCSKIDSASRTAQISSTSPKSSLVLLSYSFKLLGNWILLMKSVIGILDSHLKL